MRKATVLSLAALIMLSLFFVIGRNYNPDDHRFPASTVIDRETGEEIDFEHLLAATKETLENQKQDEQIKDPKERYKKELKDLREIFTHRNFIDLKVVGQAQLEVREIVTLLQKKFSVNAQMLTKLIDKIHENSMFYNGEKQLDYLAKINQTQQQAQQLIYELRNKFDPERVTDYDYTGPRAKDIEANMAKIKKLTSQKHRESKETECDDAIEELELKLKATKIIASLVEKASLLHFTLDIRQLPKYGDELQKYYDLTKDSKAIQILDPPRKEVSMDYLAFRKAHQENGDVKKNEENLKKSIEELYTKTREFQKEY